MAIFYTMFVQYVLELLKIIFLGKLRRSYPKLFYRGTMLAMFISVGNVVDVIEY